MLIHVLSCARIMIDLPELEPANATPRKTPRTGLQVPSAPCGLCWNPSLMVVLSALSPLCVNLISRPAIQVIAFGVRFPNASRRLCWPLAQRCRCHVDVPTDVPHGCAMMVLYGSGLDILCLSLSLSAPHRRIIMIATLGARVMVAEVCHGSADVGSSSV